MVEISTAPLTSPTAMASTEAWRRIGLVLLSTDLTTEADFRRMVGNDERPVHATRLAFDNPTTDESLRATAPRLAGAAALLPPGEAFAAIYYACTSASAVIGERGVAAAIAEGLGRAAPTVTPIRAATAAFGAMETRRISLLTPYTRHVTQSVAGAFEAAGFTVDRATCWDMTDDRVMARIRPETVAAAAIEARAPTSEAIFISCTALQSAVVAGAIEAATGVACVTSNLAAAWVCRALASPADTPPDSIHPRLQAPAPRLFANALPATSRGAFQPLAAGNDAATGGDRRIA